MDGPRDILPEGKITPGRSMPRLGPIGTAIGFHEEYKSALDEWQAFQQRHIGKVYLWSTIEQLISQGRESDGFSTEELYRALGVDQFHEARGRDWDGDENLAAALDLEAEIDYLVGGLQTRLFDDDSFDNEFISFGRQLFWRRTSVEWKAKRLIHYMKYGSENPREEVQTPREVDFNPKDNEFYAAFVKCSFRDQIIIARELTEGLSHSHCGREFLADLFEYQRKSILNPFSFLGPIRLWKGRDESDNKILLEDDEAIEFAKEIYITVFAKNQEQVENYYVRSGDSRRLSFAHIPASELGTLEPYSIGEYVTDLLSQLLPGLYQFYATREPDPTYKSLVEHANKPKPSEVVEKFLAGITSLYATDELIENAIDEISWRDIDAVRPKWESGRLSEFEREGIESWTTQETMAISTVLVNGLDKFVSQLEVPSAAIATGQLKLAFGVSGALGALSTMADTDASDVEQARAFRTMIGLLIDGPQIITRFRNDFEKLFGVPEQAARRQSVQANALAGEAAKRIGPALDILDIYLNVYSMSDAIERGDNAAWGYGAAAFSGVLGLSAAYYSAAGVLAASVGFGVAAIYIAVIGIILIAALSDSEIADWLRTTYFGVEWDDLTDEDYIKPEKDTFGYRKIDSDKGGIVQRFLPGHGWIGDPNYTAQVSQMYSQIRPIGLKEITLGKQMHQGTERYYGRIRIEPSDVYNTTEDIRIMGNGALFLRLLPVVNEHRQRETGGHPPLETVWRYRPLDLPHDHLHRFSFGAPLGDDDIVSGRHLTVTDPSWKTELAVFEQYPLLDAIEKWTGVNFPDSTLDLEIDSEEALTDDGEWVIKKWDAKIWDMSQGKSPEKIFGVAPSKIASRDKYYAEVLYAPPDLARSMGRGRSVSVRPAELPIVSRERMEIERHPVEVPVVW